jgi:Methyltransferase domain
MHKYRAAGLLQCRGLGILFGCVIATSVVLGAVIRQHVCNPRPVSFSQDRMINDARVLLQNWHSSLFTKTMNLYKMVEHASNTTAEPYGHARFSLFTPFLTCPDGRPPSRFGGLEDGGKLICADVLSTSSCVVFSLGSKNDYTFERDILERTNCTVATFDCTVNGYPVHNRHRFVKKCIGSQERMENKPDEWTTIGAAMDELGYARLDLLKIDIEGAEFDVIGRWNHHDDSLPEQISMELHYKDVYFGTSAFRNASDMSNLIWPLHELRLAELTLFMSHLASAGYGIVSREDNPSCPHCTELTLLRV